MRKYGIPAKIVKMVKAFYEDFQCAVVDNGEKSEWFDKNWSQTRVQYVRLLIPYSAGLGDGIGIFER